MREALRDCWQNCGVLDDEKLLGDEEISGIDASEDSILRPFAKAAKKNKVWMAIYLLFWELRQTKSSGLQHLWIKL
jgi:hypothetical protein